MTLLIPVDLAREETMVVAVEAEVTTVLVEEVEVVATEEVELLRVAFKTLFE